MKTKLFSIIFILFLSTEINFTQTSVLEYWENTQINGINREPMHTTLMPYENFEKAVQVKRFNSKYYNSLNGMWK